MVILFGSSPPSLSYYRKNSWGFTYSWVAFNDILTIEMLVYVSQAPQAQEYQDKEKLFYSTPALTIFVPGTILYCFLFQKNELINNIHVQFYFMKIIHMWKLSLILFWCCK